MKLRTVLIILPTLLVLNACGGSSKKDEKVEKEAKESAEEAADKSLEKLNQEGSNNKESEADSTEQ